MADQTVRGRFLWHELVTPDPAAAHGFYSKVIGWKTQAWDLDPSYTLFVANSGPIGGTTSQSGRAHWLSYIGTDDIEATVRQAQDLGGIVTREISDMPNGGRYALLEDPQGAPFGVYQSTSEHGPEKAAKRGEHSWYELATEDYQAAFEFYSALFGWEAAGEHDMGAPNGIYYMFGRNGVALGGMFNRLPEMPPPGWTAYVRVRDVQKVVPKATAEGATLIAGPMEVPGGDWIAQFVDPQGAMFAVHTVLADLKGASAHAREASVTPEEAGAQRHDDVVSAAADLKQVQPTGSASKTSKKGAAQSAKKSAAKAAKRPAKAAKKKSKTATSKTKSKTKSKSAGSKVAKKATKKVGAKKAAKKRVSRPAAKRAAPRKSARPAVRKSSKTKRPAAQRSAKKGGKKGAKRPRAKK